MINKFGIHDLDNSAADSAQPVGEQREKIDIFSEPNTVFRLLRTKYKITFNKLTISYINWMFLHPNEVLETTEVKIAIGSLSVAHNMLSRKETAIRNNMQFGNLGEDELRKKYIELLNIRNARLQVLSLLQHTMQIGHVPLEVIESLNVVKEEI